jgi:hypothetical protein
MGLPGSEKVDLPGCHKKVDFCARQCGKGTEKMLPQFRRSPQEFKHSEAYFRVLCMITILQRDLGIRYNPAKIPEDVPLDVDDTFVHGALLGEGGTCASLPVVYVAVGRRLGYPLKLVSAKGPKWGHLFARWDEPGERFNIEATNQGLTCHPDDYYRTGWYAVSSDIERRGCLLKSLTPREELAEFLAQRGCLWRDAGDYAEEVKAFTWASEAAPHNEFYTKHAEDPLAKGAALKASE